MLKWLKRLVFALFCLALLGGAVYGGGYLLPAEARLEATLSVDAEAEHVFKAFNDAEALGQWWLKSGRKGFDDFSVAHTGGPAQGPGMQLTFSGKGRELGIQTVKSATPHTQVVYDMDYLQFGLTRTIDLAAIGPLTNITWTEEATLDDPLLRYLPMLSESQVEAEIAFALEQVQAMVEPIAAEARASAAAEADRVKAEAAAARDAEDEARRKQKEQEMEEWQYTQEEAPTPIDISKPLPESE